MLIMVVWRLEHGRLGLIFDHASLMLKCWILIVLSLFWLSSNLLVFMLMFLVILQKLESPSWSLTRVLANNAWFGLI